MNCGTMDIAFAELLRPLALQDFFEEYWERRPFLGRGGAACTGLIGLRDIEHLVSSLSSPDSGWLCLIREGRELPTATYIRKDGFVSLRRVYEAFESGHTIQIAKLNRRWPPMERLARDVERQFASAGVILSRQVGSHLYLTPKGGTGLAPHFDSHDVLVLQVAGEKRWRLYEPIESLPVERQRGPLPALGTPNIEETLRAGSVMFIPRGWPHQATASSHGSIHVTLDLWPATWADMFRAMIAAEPWATTALPVGFGRRADRPPAGPVPALGLLERLGAPEVFRRAAQSLVGQFVEGLCVLPGDGFKSALEPVCLTGDTRLTKCTSAAYFIDAGADRLRLRFPESVVCVPEVARALLAFLEEQKAFSVAELPGPLSLEEKIALADRLVRERFLVPIDEQPR